MTSYSFHPSISIICPILNEENYIATCIDSILAQDYSNENMELILVDGMSSDTTRSIVKTYIKQYPFIKLLDNPDKIVPTALNKGILASSGEIIVRLDAHCIYPTYYISTLVTHLLELDADNVGGIVITRPANSSTFANAISTALSHPFGVGNSLFRIGTDKIKKVDSVPFGCFRRTLFDRIGYFDKDLTRNQDDEFNGRIIKNGGSIYLIPDLAIQYYARDSISKTAKMIFQYGLFKPLVNKKLGFPATIRQFFPFLFVSGLIGGISMGLIFRPILQLTIFVFLFYLAISIYNALKQAIIQRKIGLIFYLPLVFLVIHLSYGWGYLAGIYRFIIRNKNNTFLNHNR